MMVSSGTVVRPMTQWSAPSWGDGGVSGAKSLEDREGLSERGVDPSVDRPAGGQAASGPSGTTRVLGAAIRASGVGGVGVPSPVHATT